MNKSFRTLCAELINELHGYKVAHPNHSTELIDRARAELAKANGPAVPDGREPGAADLEKEFRSWWKETHGSPYFGAVPLVAVLSWTEYALARWGNPAPTPPADGEAAELVDWLQETGRLLSRRPDIQCRVELSLFTRAAELLQRQALVPEVGE